MKMTPFRHKMHHIRAMLLDTKIFCSLNPLRICANFYGNPIRNKKFTRFNSKLDFLRPFFLLILTKQNKALCIKIKQSSENSPESVF